MVDVVNLFSCEFFIIIYKQISWKLEQLNNSMYLDESQQKNALPFNFSPYNSQQLNFELKNQEQQQIQSASGLSKYHELEFKHFTGTTTSRILLEKVANKKIGSALTDNVEGEVEEMLNMQQIYDKNKLKVVENEKDKRQLKKVFRKYTAKKQQKSNKNFTKFLISKLFANFSEKEAGNKQWHQFNKKIEQKYRKNITIHALEQLFVGSNHQKFKQLNRQFTKQLLLDPEFYKDYFYNSHYIQNICNRKQYLLAAKIYSLRCRSANLMARIQTK